MPQLKTRCPYCKLCHADHGRCSRLTYERVPESHKPERVAAHRSLDAAEKKHLVAWLNRSVDESEQADTYGNILRALADEPDLIDRGLTWRQIADRGA